MPTFERNEYFSMIIVAFFFSLFFRFSFSQQCKYLNVMYSTKFPDHKIASVASPDGIQILARLKRNDKHHTLWRSNLDFIPIGVDIPEKVLGHSDVKEFSKNRKNKFFQISNSIEDQVSDISSPYGISFTGIIVNPIASRAENGTLYELYFTVYKTKTRDPISFHKYVKEKYSYPFKDDPLPIYNEHGVEIGKEDPNSIESTHFDLDLHDRYKGRIVYNIVSLRLLQIDAEPDTAKFLLLMYDGNKALKLIRYSWHQYSFFLLSYLHVHFASPIVPAVQGIPDFFFSALMGVSVKGSDTIYLVVNIHINQKKAFEHTHRKKHVELEFFEGQTISTFLLCVDQDGNVLRAMNVIPNDDDNKDHENDGITYVHIPESFDSKKNVVVVGGGKYAYNGTSFEYLNMFYSVVYIYGSSFVLHHFHYLNSDNNKWKKDDVKFRVETISFPIAVDANPVIIGGVIVDNKGNLVDGNGYAFLVDYVKNSTVIFELPVYPWRDDVYSEVRRIIKVAKTSGEETLFMSINLRDKVTRKYDSEVWKIDCSNPMTEQRLFMSHIIFFVLVAISFFLTVISLFCGLSRFFLKWYLPWRAKRKYEILENKFFEEKGEEETDPLLKDDIDDEKSEIIVE